MAGVKVGLVGCGAIGQILARGVAEGKAGDTMLTALYDAKVSSAQALSKALKNKPKVARSFDEFLELNFDVAVEAASQQAVFDYVPRILESGRDVVVLSVGALLDVDFRVRVENLARERKRKVYVPTGAIAGIDAVKAACVAGIRSMEIATTKSPASYESSPYVKTHRITLKKIREPQVLYEGAADDAVKGFPSNVNVAATLSLAAKRNARVKVIADPKTRRNMHEIAFEGDFGRLNLRVENETCPGNPKTSYLAALSAIALLRKLSEPIVIGT